MNLDEFREQMESYWRSVDEEGKAQKEGYIALGRLHDLYRSFDSEERTMADQVLAEWVLSSNDGMRFDALAVIEEFRIKHAAPALQKLASRLESSSEPGVPFLLEKLDRIIKHLSGHTK